jgi:serine/threonine protein kinase
MLSGRVPFPGENNKQIMENVLKGEYSLEHDAFNQVSQLSVDLIQKLLEVDVSKRLSAKDAFNHPWI